MEFLDQSIRVAIDENNPSVTIDESTCIKCKMCVNMACNKLITVNNYYSLAENGNKSVCINCGQCSVVCPRGSIHMVEDYQKVRDIIASNEKIAIVSIAPAVRASIGEEFGLEVGTFVEGKMITLLRQLGFKYVLDTNFAADLTIMEESAELLERVNNGGTLPMFTSCCPGWVKFAETFYPELIPNLSSCKSPIAMLGSLVKTYFANKIGVDAKNILNVSLAPCVAKKFEITRDELNAAGEGIKDTDYVITTRELGKWAKDAGIDFNSLEDGSFDKVMGEASKGGVIFGNTGGVMQAAIRNAYQTVTGEKAPDELFNLETLKGFENIKEATVKIGDKELNVCVCHTTKAARDVINMIKSGEKNYHFVEVMTCPGGCIAGAGQSRVFPMPKLDVVRKARISALYKGEEAKVIRVSMDNPEIQDLYKEFLGKPLGEKSEELLHTHYVDRSSDLKK